MDGYFEEVINSLTVKEIFLLNILHEHNALSKQKSIKVQTIFEMNETTEAKFRKMVDRLSALQFIIVNKDYKEHNMHISHYGISALTNMLETMGG